MNSVKELIQLGKEYFDRKEYHLAEKCLQKVVSENKGYADVYNLLGVINHIGGRFQNALDAFKKALNINPRYTEALLNLAVLYNDLGEYAKARSLYTQLKQNNKKKANDIEPVLKGKLSNLHSEIGDIYCSISMFAFSVEEYRKALHLNPAYHDIRTKLGQALREQGKLKDSEKEFKYVIKANPKYNSARVQLGVTLYTMGKIPAAKKEWQTALKHNPKDQYARMYLRLLAAQALQKSKKTSKKK